jgi:hypothetical protein
MEMITDLRCRLKRSLMKRNDGEIDGVVIMSNDLDKEKGESFSGFDFLSGNCYFILVCIP